MKLLLQKKTIETWKDALAGAGVREIGGVLFGEHLGGDDFRLIEATVQKRKGQTARFNRDGGKARRALTALSETYQNPRQFNYLGEWHSHPNAPAFPSRIDEATMFHLLGEDQIGLNFLVLLINRLRHDGRLELSAQTYLKSGHKRPCELIIEDPS